MRQLLSIALTLGLVGAASAGPVPKADRAQIVSWAAGFFADPYSLRSTGISDAVQMPNGHTVVCIEYNAKNQVGGYVGVDRQAFVYTPEGLRPGFRGLGGTHTGTCFQPQFVMRPFPELANIK